MTSSLQISLLQQNVICQRVEFNKLVILFFLLLSLKKVGTKTRKPKIEMLKKRLLLFKYHRCNSMLYVK